LKYDVIYKFNNAISGYSIEEKPETLLQAMADALIEEYVPVGAIGMLTNSCESKYALLYSIKKISSNILDLRKHSE